MTIKYYLIDPEVAFSKAPFMTGNDAANEAFSYVKEMKATPVALDPNLKSMTIPIDSDLIEKNLMIEVNAVFAHEFKTYLPSSFKTTIYDNYGELKVVDLRDKPLPQVYVKVYQKQTSGEVILYKDGYTDIRGKFEYES